jgi:hypothetical protein
VYTDAQYSAMPNTGAKKPSYVTFCQKPVTLTVCFIPAHSPERASLKELILNKLWHRLRSEVLEHGLVFLIYKMRTTPN